MASPPARPFASRLRNVIAFVAIVWGVAMTFVVFEVASLSGIELVLSHPALFGNIALSRTVTQSTTCDVRSGEKRDIPTPHASLTDARVGAWFLGVSLGRDAVLRQYAGSSRQPLDQLAAGRDDLASRLSVPPPTVFQPDQLASANVEFVGFVEQGVAETAHALAAVFSPQTCELFKLGAFWGYSEMVRSVLPGERAVFAMEIRHHARRAEVPEPLWSPMLQRLPANSKSDEVIKHMTMLTDGVTAYLAGRRQ